MGRLLAWTIRTVPSGLRIPPGLYQLVVAADNPASGTVLALVPGDGSTTLGRSDPGAAKGAIYMRFDSPAQQGGPLPVAAGPLAGSTYVVVEQGFTDLVGVVKASGNGVWVSVSQ